MIKYFLHPFNILWLLFLAATIALIFKKEKVFFVLFGISLVWFFITSNFFLPRLLVTNLENKFSPFEKQDVSSDTIAYNIIVLGAGFSPNDKLPYNAQLSSSALARLIEGIRIHNILPKSKLIVSGPVSDTQISQAEIYKKTAASLGVDTNVISIIKSAVNTFEESKEYARLFENKNPVILVTSAYHMPRAMLVFNYHGINTIGAPTDYQYKTITFKPTTLLPSLQNMNNMGLAVTEYVGTLYTKWFLFKN